MNSLARQIVKKSQTDRDVLKDLVDKLRQPDQIKSDLNLINDSLFSIKRFVDVQVFIAGLLVFFPEWL